MVIANDKRVLRQSLWFGMLATRASREAKAATGSIYSYGSIIDWPSEFPLKYICIIDAE